MRQPVRTLSDILANIKMHRLASSLGLTHYPVISRPPWANPVENIVRENYSERSIGDKFKEIGGTIIKRGNTCISNGSFKGTYLRKGNYQSYTISIPKISVRSGDILMEYHSHPINKLLSIMDIKSGVEVAKDVSSFHNMEYYDILYLPKIDRIYWFQYEKFRFHNFRQQPQPVPDVLKVQ
jgi:hypothetical protein